MENNYQLAILGTDEGADDCVERNENLEMWIRMEVEAEVESENVSRKWKLKKKGKVK